VVRGNFPAGPGAWVRTPRNNSSGLSKTESSEMPVGILLYAINHFTGVMLAAHDTR
jgi:hypothetical protein